VRILIAVPTFETIRPEVFKALWDMDAGDHDVFFDYVRGYTVDHARNNIAKKAMQMGVDYVLMVDNDVVLPPDALANLMEHDAPVALGYYVHTGKSELTCLCKTGHVNFDDQYTCDELHALRDSGVAEITVKGGGLGCALIETCVFEQISWPFFRWYVYGSGAILSEDLYFAVKCENAGIRIVADPRVACGHVKASRIDA